MSERGTLFRTVKYVNSNAAGTRVTRSACVQSWIRLYRLLYEQTTWRNSTFLRNETNTSSRRVKVNCLKELNE